MQILGQQDRTCNLLDLRDRDGVLLATQVLHKGGENDAPDVQIEPHAHSIAGYQDVIAIVSLVEQPGLLTAGLRWEGTIYQASPAGRPQTLRLVSEEVEVTASTSKFGWDHESRS